MGEDHHGDNEYDGGDGTLHISKTPSMDNYGLSIIRTRVMSREPRIGIRVLYS